jgi:hypothetical protein
MHAAMLGIGYAGGAGIGIPVRRPQCKSCGKLKATVAELEQQLADAEERYKSLERSASRQKSREP